MVVGLILEYCKGAVELLDKYGTNKLVRECHLRERQLTIGTCIYRIGEAIGPTYDKHQAFNARRHATLHKSRKLHGAKLLAMLIEKSYMVRVIDKAQYGLALQTLLLRLGEFLRVTHIGNRRDGEAHIVVQALSIHRNKRLDLLHVGLADNYKLAVHPTTTLLNYPPARFAR